MRTALRFGMSLTEYYEATDRDVYNFIRAGYERLNEDREQMWDYTRHVMWSQMASMTGKPKEPKNVMQLGRDGIEITPYQKQELREWSKRMDKEMGL